MPRPRSDNVRINLYVNPKVYNFYKKLAKRRDVSASQLIRESLKEQANLLAAEERAKMAEKAAEKSGAN
jgi:hypothetical protein